jgi:cell division protein FtsL
MNNKNNFSHKFKKVIWILTPFILLAIIIILLMKHYKVEEDCFDCYELQEKIDNIEQKIKDKDCLDCD